MNDLKLMSHAIQIDKVSTSLLQKMQVVVRLFKNLNFQTILEKSQNSPENGQ